MADNIFQKKGESMWYARLAVPADVQSAIGLKVLVQSLHTGLRSEAMTRRLSVLAQWKKTIANVREGQVLEDGWQDAVARTLAIQEGRDSRAQARLVGIDMPEPPESLELGEVVPLDLSRFASAVSLHDAETATSATTPAWMQPPGYLKSPEGQVALAKAMAKLQRQFTEFYIGEVTSMPSAQRKELAEIASNPTGYKSKSPITPARIAAYTAYCETQSISQKHIDTQRSRLQKISAYLSVNGLPLDFDTIAAYLPTLDVSSATQNQFCIAGSNFWKWANKYDPAWRSTFKEKANPFQKHTFPKLKGKALTDSQRKAFSLHDLAKLHKAAHAMNRPVLADLILLATYSGARIEELCQLKTENVIDDDGVRSFDIVDSKTTAGIRKVPVHPALAPVVDRLIADSTDGWLLPIKTANKYGKRSDGLSKLFGRLRTAQGYDPKYVFHSIRMAMITQLQRAGVSSMLIAELAGHDTGTVTFDTYAQGFSSRQKMQAISALPVLSI